MKNSFAVHGAWHSLKLMIKRRVFSWVVNGRSSRRPDKFAVLPGDHVSNEIIISGFYEERFLAPLFEHWFKPAIDGFSTGIALDVGANIGNHSIYFSRFFKKIYAFEPNPVALTLLECNIKLNHCSNATIVPCGLGDVEGDFDFIQNRDGNLGGSGFVYAGVSSVAETTTKFPVIVGDEFFKNEKIDEPIRLIKLDIEGGEVFALNGLVGTLRKYQPIILFESNNGGDGNKIIDLLRALGYQHFSVLEDSSQRYGRIGKLISVLFFGETIRLVSIASLTNEKYPMVIASREPFVASMGTDCAC